MGLFYVEHNVIFAEAICFGILVETHLKFRLNLTITAKYCIILPKAMW